MKEVIFEIIENSRLSDGIYLMRLAGDTSAVTAPGQFVNLKLAGRYLRRPIHSWPQRASPRQERYLLPRL